MIYRFRHKTTGSIFSCVSTGLNKAKQNLRSLVKKYEDWEYMGIEL